jgi:hypothetical protein
LKSGLLTAFKDSSIPFFPDLPPKRKKNTQPFSSVLLVPCSYQGVDPINRAASSIHNGEARKMVAVGYDVPERFSKIALCQ